MANKTSRSIKNSRRKPRVTPSVRNRRSPRSQKRARFAQLKRLWRGVTFLFRQPLVFQLKGRTFKMSLSWQRSILIHLILILVVVVSTWQMAAKLEEAKLTAVTQPSVNASLVMLPAPVAKPKASKPAEHHQAKPPQKKEVKPNKPKPHKPVQPKVEKEKTITHAVPKPKPKPKTKAKPKSPPKPVEAKKPEPRKIPPKPKEVKAKKTPAKATPKPDTTPEAKTPVTPPKAQAKPKITAEDKAKRLAALKALGASNLDQAIAAHQAAEQAEQLRDRYVNLIKQQITHVWNNPFAGDGHGYRVQLSVQVDAQGQVQSVNVAHSSGNRIFDRQVIQAVWRASPLPVPDNVRVREKWFQSLTLEFSNPV